MTVEGSYMDLSSVYMLIWRTVFNEVALSASTLLLRPRRTTDRASEWTQARERYKMSIAHCKTFRS